MSAGVLNKICLLVPIVWAIAVIGSRPLHAQTTDFEIELGHSYTEPTTGLLFSRSIADLDLIVRTKYDDKKWGTSLRYQHPTRAEWIDVYIYNRGLEEITDKKDLEQTMGEVESAFGGIEAYTGEGKPYRKLVIDDEVETREIEMGEEFFRLASRGASFEKRSSEDPEKYLPSRTSISVATYRNQFVKIRHTIPISLGKKKCEQQRVEVIKGLLALVKEHPLRSKVVEAVETFSKDPLSEEGQDARALIVSYAEASKIVSVVISADVLPMFEEEDESLEEDLGANFLSAFIAGCVGAQLKNGSPDPYPGVVEQLKLYKILRKSGKIEEPLGAYEEWLKKEKAGTLEAHIAALGEEKEAEE